MSSKISKIAVLTSGGDSPGMNAAIRAVVRTSLHYKLQVYGVNRGYEGLIDNDFTQMAYHSVSNIIQRGGTILRSSRSEKFRTVEGMQTAFDNLAKNEINGLVVIGGDGSFKGAKELSEKFAINCIGIPGTIDNDLYGTDYTLGYDTAINTAMHAIDNIRDTAAAHDRLFFIEVMGRDAGFIALRSGIAGGAEAILVPEMKTNLDQLTSTIEAGWKKKKQSMIVVIAEGDDAGGAFKVAESVKKKIKNCEIKVSILGHIQRGGSPTCLDRVLGSRMGVAAVEALLNGDKNVMLGLEHRSIVHIPFSKAIKHHKVINKNLLELSEILST